MAQRAERADDGRFRQLKLKLGGRDGLDVERVRAVRGVTDLPLQVDVNEYWELDEALAAAWSWRRSASSTWSSRSRRRPRRCAAQAGVAAPDLRRRGRAHAGDRRSLCRARPRHQHQARQERRHPRGGAHGARGARARARRHARLHDRVGPRHLGRRQIGSLCDHRSRRQSPARGGSVAGVDFAEGVQVPRPTRAGSP